MAIRRDRVGPGGEKSADEIVPLSVQSDVEGRGFPFECSVIDWSAHLKQVVDNIGGADVDGCHECALVIDTPAEVGDWRAGLDRKSHEPDVSLAGGPHQRSRPLREPRLKPLTGDQSSVAVANFGLRAKSRASASASWTRMDWNSKISSLESIDDRWPSSAITALGGHNQLPPLISIIYELHHQRGACQGAPGYRD